MSTPSRPTPAVCPPTVMIVAACVSCCRFSVTVSPFRVVVVSESGIGPTASEPGVQTAAVAEVPPSAAKETL